MATFAVDTNVWLRAVDAASTQHVQATSALERLQTNGDTIALAPQNLYEIWVVITRPLNANGMGMTPSDAHARLEVMQDLFTLLPETPEVFGQWLNLVVGQNVSGKPAHDARLVAWMKVHGLQKLLTFNGDDFKRYGLEVIHPSDLFGGETDES